MRAIRLIRIRAQSWDCRPMDGFSISRSLAVGQPYIVNNPSGGAERFDAAALGVYAFPLPWTGTAGFP